MSDCVVQSPESRLFPEGIYFLESLEMSNHPEGLTFPEMLTNFAHAMRSSDGASAVVGEDGQLRMQLSEHIAVSGHQFGCQGQENGSGCGLEGFQQVRPHFLNHY